TLMAQASVTERLGNRSCNQRQPDTSVNQLIPGRTSMRKTMWMFAALPLVAAAADSPYQPLAFLAGHCWKGTFPDGKQTDEHCFSWIYDGKFLRDQHTVHGGGHPDYLGESIYFWNSASKRVEYLYIENQGGYSQGPVATEGRTLVFPPTQYVENGETQTYRS